MVVEVCCRLHDCTFAAHEYIYKIKCVVHALVAMREAPNRLFSESKLQNSRFCGAEWRSATRMGTQRGWERLLHHAEGDRTGDANGGGDKEDTSFR
jgi:hypothetical protein